MLSERKKNSLSINGECFSFSFSFFFFFSSLFRSLFIRFGDFFTVAVVRCCIFYIFSCTINPFQSIPSEFLLTNEDYMLLLFFVLCLSSPFTFSLSSTLSKKCKKRLLFLSVALEFIYNLMTFGQHTIFSVDKKKEGKEKKQRQNL